MAIAKKAIGGPKIVDPAPKKKTKKAIAGHTGGGMKLPERKPRGKRPTPKVSDTGTGLLRRKITSEMMKKAKAAGLRKRAATQRARAGNRSRRGLRR